MNHKMRLYLHRMQVMDSMVCVKISQTNQYRIIRYVFRIVSRLGDGMFWYMLMAGLLVFYSFEAITPVAHMVLSGLTGTLIYKWIKQTTSRPRPFQVRHDVWAVGKPLDHFSFPSGHTLHAVVFGLIAIHYYSALTIVLMPFMMMVAMSRVILGLHYPSDVVAGAAIGYVLVRLSFLIL